MLEARKKGTMPKYKGGDKKTSVFIMVGKPRSKFICNYCKKLGHIKAICFDSDEANLVMDTKDLHFLETMELEDGEEK